MSNSFATPWTAACQTPLSMGFARQEYWSGLPFPSPGDLPNPGIEPASPVLEGRFFTAKPLREAHIYVISFYINFSIFIELVYIIETCWREWYTHLKIVMFSTNDSHFHQQMCPFCHIFASTRCHKPLTILPILICENLCLVIA